MSTVCYCGQPDCPVTTWERDACVANLRTERDALKAQVEAHAHDLGSLRSAVHDALPLDYPDGLLIKQVSVMGAELVRLRRQVEAARKALSGHADCQCGNIEPNHVLDAMDAAK